VTVRHATVEDATAIGRLSVRVWQRAYRGQMPDEYLDGLRPEGRASYWRPILHQPHDEVSVIVAEQAGAIIGMIKAHSILCRMPRPPGPPGSRALHTAGRCASPQVAQLKGNHRAAISWSEHPAIAVRLRGHEAPQGQGRRKPLPWEARLAAALWGVRMPSVFSDSAECVFGFFGARLRYHLHQIQ
jgi:hypothetical protein